MLTHFQTFQCCVSFSLRRKVPSEYTSKSPSTGRWVGSVLGIPLRDHHISSNFLLPEYKITITESQKQRAPGLSMATTVLKVDTKVIQQVAACPRRCGQALPPGVQERAQQECLGPGQLGGVPGLGTRSGSRGPTGLWEAGAQGSLRCWAPGVLGRRGHGTRGRCWARGARGP